MNTTTIQFRTDDKNAKEIETMARSYGLSISAYLRMLSKRDFQTYASVKLAKVEAPVETLPVIDDVA